MVGGFHWLVGPTLLLCGRRLPTETTQTGTEAAESRVSQFERTPRLHCHQYMTRRQAWAEKAETATHARWFRAYFEPSNKHGMGDQLRRRLGTSLMGDQDRTLTQPWTLWKRTHKQASSCPYIPSLSPIDYHAELLSSRIWCKNMRKFDQASPFPNQRRNHVAKQS